MYAPAPSATSTKPVSTLSKNLPATWSRRPKICGEAWKVCRPPPEVEAENIALLRDGIVGIERGFVNVLERNGIVRQDPTGLPFDPHFHQAMAEQESAEHPPGTILQAWTPVWTLNGRLLRAAMVVVAKAPASQAAASRMRPDLTV